MSSQNCLFPTPGPTICYDVMEKLDLAPIPARFATATTPVIFEVAADSGKEQVIELTVNTPKSTDESSVLTNPQNVFTLTVRKRVIYI